MACATMPTTATSTATAKRRRWATNKTATVAAGVAAADSAASTLKASAPATGHRKVTGISAQLATPTETSRMSIPVEAPEVNWPQSVSPVSAPTAITTQAVMTAPGPPPVPPTDRSPGCRGRRAVLCHCGHVCLHMAKPKTGGTRSTPTKVEVA